MEVFWRWAGTLRDRANDDKALQEANKLSQGVGLWRSLPVSPVMLRDLNGHLACGCSANVCYIEIGIHVTIVTPRLDSYTGKMSCLRARSGL